MSADKLRTPDVERLLEAFLALETTDDLYAFLLDVATVRELHDLAQRLAVARMLDAGEHYDRISEVTGASSTTISRVSRSLNYGADGYRVVLDATKASGGLDDERPGE
ncbi:MAG: YerC/YecD family TrpR-related protein [Coriobacteriia bacterium]|nr:YerC/YecD family TrpR-related protein [Coriobacteriia bacterium]